MIAADEDVCPDCGGMGWVHMEDPFEIQMCDSCGVLGSDYEAALVHRVGCRVPGCEWGTVYEDADWCGICRCLLDPQVDDEDLCADCSADEGAVDVMMDAMKDVRPSPACCRCGGGPVEEFYCTPCLQDVGVRPWIGGKRQ